MRATTAITSLCAMVLLASPASPTTIGPRLAQVLGWDPRDQEVFVAIHDHSESGYLPQVVYFDLKTPKAGPQTVKWSVGFQGDPQFGKHFSDLRKRLVPLIHEDLYPSSFDFRVETTDTVNIRGASIPHYRGRVEIGPARLSVSTYGQMPRGVVLFTIPGRQQKLLIVSVGGVNGEEAQVPVLLDAGGESDRPVEEILRP